MIARCYCKVDEHISGGLLLAHLAIIGLKDSLCDEYLASPQLVIDFCDSEEYLLYRSTSQTSDDLHKLLTEALTEVQESKTDRAVARPGMSRMFARPPNLRVLFLPTPASFFPRHADGSCYFWKNKGENDNRLWDSYRSFRNDVSPVTACLYLYRHKRPAEISTAECPDM